ncbi:cuticle protein 18.6-like [Penaeus japonicus]|uniref:cuticle protein 18.6-like n=1 Tax=Penaeus japonicus TaxID=27405 RepID=UPI001C71686D|nr:cuticle protein 18.6-like [Penaeus japonicus]
MPALSNEPALAYRSAPSTRPTPTYRPSPAYAPVPVASSPSRLYVTSTVQHVTLICPPANNTDTSPAIFTFLAHRLLTKKLESVFFCEQVSETPKLSQSYVMRILQDSMQVIAFLALASAALARPQYSYSPAPAYRPAPSYAPAPAYRPAPSYQQVPAQYNFDWGVVDDYSGNNYGHQESRDGYNTQGSYYVQLPDGRLQKVTYYVDGDSGFVAEVSYEGQAQYPAYQPAPSYRPAPTYTPAPVYG